ncbi:hypothetical protein [Neorhizobium galegae]|uniref:hypothetical protein n=1 Tax=Neorhizobium galegae TaxID=399 RepID=UPI002107AC9C|nr:hypothetical protein [Neorhizobium galegae]MCQ1853146.1 hypothetical protein [Neorhizobium galegae]
MMIAIFGLAMKTSCVWEMDWAGPQEYGGKAEVVKPTQGAGGKDHPLHAIVSVLNREFRGRGKDIAATEGLIRIFERQDAEHRSDHDDEYNAHKDAPSAGQTSSACEGSGAGFIRR